MGGSRAAEGSWLSRARSLMLGVLVFTGACARTGCHTHDERRREPGVSSSEPLHDSSADSSTRAAEGAHADAGRDARVRVLNGDRYRRLSLDGFGDAIVHVPVGATSKAPLVVAAHGNYDRPEWQCQTWGAFLPHAFIVCPRGFERDDSPSKADRRFSYRGAMAFAKEASAAVVRARDEFNGWITDGTDAFVGFSLGAILGVPYVAGLEEPPRLIVLIEGGHDHMTVARSKLLAGRGSREVVFGCGQTACVRDAKIAMKRARAGGLEPRLAVAPGQGHAYAGEVALEVARATGWANEPDGGPAHDDGN